MAAYHKQNSHAIKKKVSISYVIREKDERYHRSGVNSLQYDTYLDRLYSAGRDSVIRIWGFKDESPKVTSRTPNSNERFDGGRKVNNDHFLQSMEHHTDWVNDIVLCCNGRNLISVSNDTTIKVWDAHQGFCLSTLRSHKDYAKCLAYAKDREVLASAGFDRMIYLWDIHSLTMLTAAKTSVETKSLDGSRNSIYSLAINQTGTLVATGSTEKVIRLWDPRSRQKLLKLRGHTDNVRSLLFSKDGSMLLSASSDGTIRLWSITQQRCVSIIRVHDGGVWTLQSDDSFNTVFSGGKDGRIFMTSLKNTSNTALVCEEKSPILKIHLVDRCYSPSNTRGNSSLWVATTDSGLRNWSLNTKNQDYFRDNHDHCAPSERNNDPVEVPINISPDLQLKGNPAVVNYQILNDRRHILTRESDNSIALYDVLTARKIETLYSATTTNTRETYEAEIKKRFKLVYVPNWFTVDLKIGLLCIHLEENECLSAWVSAKDYGFTNGQDPKVNLGCLILKALFEHWPPTYDSYDDDDFRESESQAASNNATLDDYHDSQLSKNVQPPSRHKISIASHDQLNSSVTHRVGNQYFSIASHTPIIISEGSQTLLRFLAYEANNENEDIFLQEIIPPWLSDIVISKCQPKFTKIPFFLLPHVDSGIKSLRKERLSASDMLQMHKVIEHVCEKMMVNIMNENGTNQESGANSKGMSSSNEQMKFPTNKIELYCNDQKLEEHLDLRTVKHYIWKSGGDLVLYYMPIK